MKLHPVDVTAVTLLKTAIAAAVMLTALGMFSQKPLHATEHISGPRGAAVDWSETMGDGDLMRVTTEQLNILCDIAEAAGREVMAVYAQDFDSWEKDDASPLTEADLRADSVIRSGLETHFPGIFILSEESISADPAPVADTFFLVDPLDGTKEFLKHNDEFTVNIALIHQGQPIAGVVLAPALEQLFFAAQGLGAWQRDGAGVHALRVALYREAAPLRVIGSRSHGGDALSAWLAKLNHEHRFVAVGSSLKFCRIAEGQADIYPRFGPTSQWDTAAAQCVLELAGGTVTNLAGRHLSYGLDKPVLNAQFLAVGDVRLLSLLTYRPGPIIHDGA
jgi:3'(2'), 5'-bisphosphate nucleotidase